MSDWMIDEVAARHCATRPERDKGAAPHWLRCDAIRTVEYLGIGEYVERCILGDGHSGDHVAPKVADPQ